MNLSPVITLKLSGINKLKDENLENSDGIIESSTWKDYFKNLNSVDPSKMSLSKSFLERLGSFHIPESCVLDQEFSLDEFSAANKNNKNGGADGLLNEMLKYGQFVLLPCFQRLFNYILSSGNYPKLWSNGLVLPIYKSGNAHDPCNYRGIAITSCLAKLFNRLMNKRLTRFLIVSLVFSYLGFWSGNLFLIAPFPDLCLLVPS